MYCLCDGGFGRVVAVMCLWLVLMPRSYGAFNHHQLILQWDDDDEINIGNSIELNQTVTQQNQLKEKTNEMIWIRIEENINNNNSDDAGDDVGRHNVRFTKVSKLYSIAEIYWIRVEIDEEMATTNNEQRDAARGRACCVGLFERMHYKPHIDRVACVRLYAMDLSVRQTELNEWVLQNIYAGSDTVFFRIWICDIRAKIK